MPDHRERAQLIRIRHELYEVLRDPESIRLPGASWEGLLRDIEIVEARLSELDQQERQARHHNVHSCFVPNGVPGSITTCGVCRVARLRREDGGVEEWPYNAAEPVRVIAVPDIGSQHVGYIPAYPQRKCLTCGLPWPCKWTELGGHVPYRNELEPNRVRILFERPAGILPSPSPAPAPVSKPSPVVCRDCRMEDQKLDIAGRCASCTGLADLQLPVTVLEPRVNRMLAGRPGWEAQLSVALAIISLIICVIAVMT